MAKSQKRTEAGTAPGNRLMTRLPRREKLFRWFGEEPTGMTLSSRGPARGPHERRSTAARRKWNRLGVGDQRSVRRSFIRASVSDLCLHRDRWLVGVESAFVVD